MRFRVFEGEKMVRVISALSLCLFALHSFAAGEVPRKVELSQNWTLASAKDVQADGAAVSQPGFQGREWHPIHRMPATVLEILQEDGVYPNLYVGKNMLENVPQDLWKQDWWYRTVVHRTRRFLQLHVGVSGNQLSRGNLAQWSEGRRQ